MTDVHALCGGIVWFLNKKISTDYSCYFALLLLDSDDWDILLNHIVIIKGLCIKSLHIVACLDRLGLNLSCSEVYSGVVLYIFMLLQCFMLLEHTLFSTSEFKGCWLDYMNSLNLLPSAWLDTSLCFYYCPKTHDTASSYFNLWYLSKLSKPLASVHQWKPSRNQYYTYFSFLLHSRWRFKQLINTINYVRNWYRNNEM